MWIVKALWKLEEPVPVQSFPDFLDDRCVEYLIELAKKSFEYDEIKSHYEQLRSKLLKLREMVEDDLLEQKAKETT